MNNLREQTERTRHEAVVVAKRRARRLNRKAAISATVAAWFGSRATTYQNKARATMRARAW
jgi:hypothetical protein